MGSDDSASFGRLAASPLAFGRARRGFRDPEECSPGAPPLQQLLPRKSAPAHRNDRRENAALLLLWLPLAQGAPRRLLGEGRSVGRRRREEGARALLPLLAGQVRLAAPGEPGGAERGWPERSAPTPGCPPRPRSDGRHRAPLPGPGQLRWPRASASPHRCHLPRHSTPGTRCWLSGTAPFPPPSPPPSRPRPSLGPRSPAASRSRPGRSLHRLRGQSWPEGNPAG